MTPGVHLDLSQQRVPRRVAVLTRPAGQSAAMCDALTRVGIQSLDFPLIDIQPITDYEALDAALDMVRNTGLNAERDREGKAESKSEGYTDGLNTSPFALLFFVSPNAIDQVFARATARGIDLTALLTRQGGEPIIAVVGPGSVRALAAHGVTPMTHRIIAPEGAMDEVMRQESGAPRGDVERAAMQTTLSAPVGDGDAPSPHAVLSPADAIRYDSEALWQALSAEVEAGWLAGRSALIVRGDGGREWFADALRTAGMAVHAVAAYRRGLPRVDEETWQQIDSLIDSQQAVWVLSSSEGVRNLETLAFARYVEGRSALHATPDPRYAALKRCTVIVPHHRIAEAASRAGFDTITICGGGDANLLRAICGVQNEHARIANENGKPYA